MMIGLLPEDLRRQLQLLEIISIGGTFPIDFLEEQINCSSKTLKNDLIKIANYIDELVITCKGQKGKIAVTKTQNFLEASIYQAVMEESIEITYLEKILIAGYQKLEEVCNEMFISESGAKRMIKRINHTLNKYGLRICAGKITAEHPVMLTIFITRLLFEKYQLYDNCFPEKTCRFFRNAVQSFVAENQLESYWETTGIREKNYFLIYVTCCFLQIENGVIPCNEREGYELEKTAFELQKLLPQNSRFSAKECAQTIFGEEMVQLFLKLPLEGTDSVLEPSLQKLSDLIDKIGEKLEITCEHKELILNNCFVFLKKNHIWHYLFYDHNEMFLKKIVERHPVFFDTFRKKLEKVYSEKTESESTDFLIKQTLIEIVVNWEELLLILDRGLLNSQGLLIMDGSRNQINYICSILRSELGEVAKINVYSEYPFQLDETVDQTFDFIITNIQLFSKVAAKKVFTVSVFPTEDEIKRIEAFCKRSNLDHQLEKIGF